MPIDTVQDLRDHIRLAMQVELTTIPPYLYAMYSLEDPRCEAALLIRSVVVEEMLHAALAANLLVAVGGEPDFANADVVPRFPGPLPHHVPELMLHLAPASPELLRDVCMVIEQPEAPGAMPEEDEFETLGQFYEALEAAIERIAGTTDLFADPRVHRQLADPTFYGAVEFDAEDSGGLLAITDVATAREAIEIVVHQGEGLSDELWADPSHQELTHYHKFKRIAEGESPLGRVRNLMVDPTRDALPASLQPVCDLYNAMYRFVFVLLDRLYSGKEDQHELIGRFYRIMAGTLPAVGRYLTAQPLGDGTFAGPSFEVFDFGGSDPVERLVELASAVLEEHPDLDEALSTIALL